MNRGEMIRRVRSLTRDLSNAIFREIDVTEYLNESIDRMQQVLPQLDKMVYLQQNSDVPLILPKKYHSLMPIFSAARCFSQDERHYQATTLMNEFETKLEEFKAAVESGEVVLIDPETGEEIIDTNETGYVFDNYFPNRNGVYRKRGG